jgi:hypothetical protein
MPLNAILERFIAAVPEVNAAPSPMTIHDVAVDVDSWPSGGERLRRWARSIVRLR